MSTIYKKLTYVGGNWIVEDIPEEKTLALDNVCLHEFKEYLGFTEKYHYCIRCDKKQEKANEETGLMFY